MSEKRFVACDKWADSEGNIFRFVVIDTKVFGDKQFILRCNHWSQAQDICNRLNDTLDELREENEQLQRIGVMYQGHNPCSNCTYCVEDKVCCGIYPPILCDEMKKDYFVYGLCKKHKQIQKSIRRYGD